MRNDQHLTLLTGLFGILTAIFAGWFFIAGSSRAWSGGSKADPKLAAKAEEDVDLWEKKFGLTSSRT